MTEVDTKQRIYVGILYPRERWYVKGYILHNESNIVYNVWLEEGGIVLQEARRLG